MWTMIEKWLIIKTIFCFFLFKGLDTVTVKLVIEPKVVKRFQVATLKCFYDINPSNLYTVKWFRGTKEFYRFIPNAGDEPNTKVFLYPGIVVDENNSNSTQVVLRDIDFNIAGNFTCEITKDVTFSTYSDTEKMTVVKIPQFPPTISVEGEPLDIGDILRANCTSEAARPPAILTFILNGYELAKSEPLKPSQMQEMAWSDLSLEVLLTPSHFHAGRLILQCLAEINEIYRDVATLELATIRGPVHEKVSAAEAGTSSASSFALSLLFCFVASLSTS